MITIMMTCLLHVVNLNAVGIIGDIQQFFWCVLFLAVCFLPTIGAMTASPHNFTVRQFNETITLKINGDEFSHWISDVNDYAVMRDDEGLYTYAKLSDDGKLVPSKAQVGHLHSTTEDLPIKGLRPKAANDGNASGKSKNRSGCAKESGCEGRTFTTPSSSGSLRGIIPDQNRRRTATVGTLKNLVVLVRFSDHNRRVLPSKNEINILMNSEEADPKYSPTGSLKMVYWENSYGLLTIDSQVTDWIRVSKPESYYAAGESGVGTRRLFQEALVEVLNKLEAQGFDFSSFDQDKDTHIDSIAFMTSGYGAEWGGNGFENRIWSHQWSIDWTSSKTGVKITRYHVSPALWGTSGNSIGRVGVIAHETGHFLGLEDHYDVDYSGNGLGFFCLMANSWGYDGSQLYPPQMSAWAKMKLSWSIPRIPSVGLNVVARSEVPNNARNANHLYKVGDGRFGFPRGEYLLIEYRKANWLKGGVAIYHIDELAPYDDEGYPGQVDSAGVAWPSNGKHYKIALVPSDGSYELEQGINQGNSFDLFKGGDYLVPSSVTRGDKKFPNTDTYQRGIVGQTKVEIYALSEPDANVMTFVFWDGNAAGWSWLSKYYVKERQTNAAAPDAALLSDQAWMTVLFEQFDNGPGAFTLGSDSKMEDKKCRSIGGCVKNKGVSTISATIDISPFSELEISFDFSSNGLMVGEAIRLEYSAVGSSNWDLVHSWVMGEGSFSDKEWTSTSTIWNLSALHEATVKLRFRATSEKKVFYIDNIVIRGK